jgi:ribosome-binding factor A
MSRRVARVADSIQQTVAELLLREIKDPRIGMVSVTGVTLSADLRHARVFFSVIGDEAQRARSLAGLQSAGGFIRKEVARRLKLRVAPELVFEFDPSLERGARIAELLATTLPDDDERDPDR